MLPSADAAAWTGLSAVALPSDVIGTDLWLIHWKPATVASRRQRPTANRPISDPLNGSFLPKKRISQNEANVIAGMTQMFSSIAASALHRVELFEVDGRLVAVDEQHDGQTHADFGGGDRDDEQGEHLAGDRRRRTAHEAEGDEVDVDGVEDQLDRHEDEHAVLPREHAVHTDGEQGRAEEEALVEQHRLSPSLPGRWRRRGRRGEAPTRSRTGRGRSRRWRHRRRGCHASG